MTSQLRRTAEHLATRRLAATLAPGAMRDAPPGYTYDPRDNLIHTVSEDDFWSDLDAGAGGHLIETSSAPPKFCAACSSAALAVNSFGPFRHSPERLSLLGESGFQEFQFDKQLPNGLQGTPPHLDAFAVAGDRVFCIASKFLEPLADKDARFPAAYAGAIGQLAEEPWAALYHSLIAAPRRFRRLDAAQLIRHYLGMRNSLSDSFSQLTLLYLYWEPGDAAGVPEFVTHREEVAAFAAAVAGASVRFVALSYPALWSEWERAAAWPDAGEHVALLRQRYAFPLLG